MKKAIFLSVTKFMTFLFVLTSALYFTGTPRPAAEARETADSSSKISASDIAGSEYAVETGLEDGEYSVDVILEGGSGRASVASPAALTVRDSRAYARIEWSSSSYDYMKINGETYLPVNEGGNSAFVIPVTVFDEPVTVIGDTTAMSVPHEVEYTLTFKEASISPASDGNPTLPAGSLSAVLPAAAVCAAAAVIIFLFFPFRTGKEARKK